MDRIEYSSGIRKERSGVVVGVGSCELSGLPLDSEDKVVFRAVP